MSETQYVTISVKKDKEPPNEKLLKIDFIDLQYRVSQFLKEEGRFFASETFMKESGKFSEDEVFYTCMGTKFAFQEEVEECMGICTCSDEIQEAYDIFQYSDYVTMPMIWCQYCDRRSFICVECKPDVTETKDSVSYKYPLVTVDRVLNTQLYTWKWTSELFRLHIDEFLKIRGQKDVYYSRKIEMEEEYAKKIGLESLEDIEDLTEDEVNQLWECSALCESNNTDDVKLPLDMSHDGIIIQCKCHCDNCGSVFNAKYWGD